MATPDLATLVLAAGGLGIAAKGLVDVLKHADRVGLAGFPVLWRHLAPVRPALAAAYGEDVRELLEAQYRHRRGEGAARKTIRQGVRVGLTKLDESALRTLVQGIGTVLDHDDFVAAAKAVGSAGGTPADEHRQAIARFELALDARIDAGLALAEDRYKRTAVACATGISILLGLVIAPSVGGTWLQGLIVGLAGVPLAPVAQDLSKAITNFARSVGSR